MTDMYDYPVCDQCERHLRNGLIHYRPSNGTEGGMFMERCEDCRHCKDNPEDPKPPKLTAPYELCAYGVLDRVVTQMFESYGHISTWFDPADLNDKLEDGSPRCPAECKRFTHRDDPNGALRDPPRPDCEGQMFLEELLPVVREVVPIRVKGRQLSASRAAVAGKGTAS